MQPILAVMLDALHADAARLERTGANLVNASTPGYQREVVVATSRGAAGTAAAPDFAQWMASAPSPLVSATPVLRTLADTRPGRLAATERPLDVALAGPGLFEVTTPDGPAYTRRGDFGLDAKGRLVHTSGHPVAGVEGDIVPGPAGGRIDEQGRVHAGGRVVGRLKVVELPAESPRRPLGAGLFAADAPTRSLAEADVNLQPGHLERANVNAAHEMVQLMQTMRHFESISRLLQGYDEMLGGAIRRLGEA